MNTSPSKWTKEQVKAWLKNLAMLDTFWSNVDDEGDE